jgi:hypothetical protein
VRGGRIGGGPRGSARFADGETGFIYAPIYDDERLIFLVAVMKIRAA